MKRLLLALAVLVLCSAQTCSIPDGTPAGQNICDRNWFNGTYRVGIDLPSGIGPTHAGTPVSGVTAPVLNVAWDWNVTNPAVTFSVVVFQPVTGQTIQDVRNSMIDDDTISSQFDIMLEQLFKLDDSSQAWYLALSPKNTSNINVEYVMTITQSRLVYVSATYGSTLVSDTQADQIGETLRSLCADLE